MPPEPDVAAYLEALPEQARPVVERLRAIVREHDGTLTETIRYGIPTFQREGRSVLHVAGYARHVSIHPRPEADDELEPLIAPYVAGKGTLRFALAEPLPEDVVRRVVAALVAR